MPRSMTAAILLIAIFCLGIAEAKPAPRAKCAVAKRAAVIKKIAGKLKCQATADFKNQALDPLCIAKVESKFLKAFAKAESKNGCLRNGDATFQETRADTFLATLLGDLPPVCFGFNGPCTTDDPSVCCSNSCSAIVGNNGLCD